MNTEHKKQGAGGYKTPRPQSWDWGSYMVASPYFHQGLVIPTKPQGIASLYIRPTFTIPTNAQVIYGK